MEMTHSLVSRDTVILPFLVLLRYLIWECLSLKVKYRMAYRTNLLQILLNGTIWHGNEASLVSRDTEILPYLVLLVYLIW